MDENSTTMCPMPFVNLAVTVSGDLRICCKNKLKIGNIAQDDFNQVYREHSELNQLRRDLLNGHRNSLCNVCWENENSGTTSLRQLIQYKFKEPIDADNPTIKNLDITPSNTCNFKCRICNEKSSSKILNEIIRFEPNRKNKMIELNNSIRSTGPELIKHTSLYDEITSLHIFGGEPYLWAEFPMLMEHLIQNNLSSNIQLEFNTNGSLYPEKIINNIISHFKRVEIHISIDAIGRQFEIQRGGEWKTVLSNIQKYCWLRDHHHHVGINLATAVNIQNLLYLDSIVDFADSLGVEIVWIYLEEPQHYCIDYVTRAVKDIVYEKYHNHHNEELRKIAQRVCSKPAVSGREFLNNVLKYDSYRDETFKISHEEIFNAMSQD